MKINNTLPSVPVWTLRSSDTPVEQHFYKGMVSVHRSCVDSEGIFDKKQEYFQSFSDRLKDDEFKFYCCCFQFACTRGSISQEM